MAEPEFPHNSQAQSHHLIGDLRHLFPRLSRPELCLINGWIEKQLTISRRRPSMRIVRVPDLDDQLEFSGDLPELLGTIRHHIERLPQSHLVLLTHWVESQLLERASG